MCATIHVWGGRFGQNRPFVSSGGSMKKYLKLRVGDLPHYRGQGLDWWVVGWDQDCGNVEKIVFIKSRITNVELIEFSGSKSYINLTGLLAFKLNNNLGVLEIV